MDRCGEQQCCRPGSLKPGQRSQITATLKRLRADEDLLGVSLAAVHDANLTSWNEEISDATQEVFLSTFGPGPGGNGGGTALCQEFFTDTERIRLTAERRGHNTGASKTLRTG